MQSGLDSIRDRPVIIGEQLSEWRREVPCMKEYQKNPIGYLKKLEEYVHHFQLVDWEKIKAIIDKGFKQMVDNWWIASREDMGNYSEFRTRFQQRYWSESRQHRVRGELDDGHYDPKREQTPTAYFLGKVSLARNLVPPMPEEILCSKIAYHFNENIRRARLCNQITTVSHMLSLLEDYENDVEYQARRGNRDKVDQTRKSFNQNANSSQVHKDIQIRNFAPRENNNGGIRLNYQSNGINRNYQQNPVYNNTNNNSRFGNNRFNNENRNTNWRSQNAQRDSNQHQRAVSNQHYNRSYSPQRNQNRNSDSYNRNWNNSSQNENREPNTNRNKHVGWLSKPYNMTQRRSRSAENVREDNAERRDAPSQSSAEN
jgi:hypothetical protein